MDTRAVRAERAELASNTALLYFKDMEKIRGVCGAGVEAQPSYAEQIVIMKILCVASCVDFVLFVVSLRHLLFLVDLC